MTPPDLAPVPGPLDAPAPELAEYRGQLVTWTGWEPGLWTSLRFHADLSCEACGEDPGPRPTCWGMVPGSRDAEVLVAATESPDAGRQVRLLAASRCPGCGAVFVISLVDPRWSWSWGGPGSPLPMGVEHREVPPEPKVPRARRARGPRTRPGVVQEGPAGTPATEDTRRAAREAVAAHLASRRGRASR